MNPLRIWWADSRGKVVVTLFVLWMGSLVNHFEPRHIWQPIVSVAAVAIFDYFVSLIRHKKGVITMSSVVTGLIVGLVFYDGAGSIPLLLACFIAVIGKQLIAFGDHRHIFNPAALGILASSLLFNRPVAWWGGAWGIIPVVIVLIGMSRVLYRIRRLWMAGVFLLAYLIISESIQLTIDGTVFLFAFIMLPEPITSIGGNLWQYGWGVLVAILVFVQRFLPFASVDPFLLALLSADLIGFLFVRKLWVTRS